MWVARMSRGGPRLGVHWWGRRRRFIGFTLALDRRDHGPQNTVDESPRAVPAESLGDFDRLVDRGLRREVPLVAQFVDGETQDVAVDRRELADGEGRRRRRDVPIDLVASAYRAAHEPLDVAPCLLRGRLIG